MKIRISRKSLLQQSTPRYAVGYCDLQYLLYFVDPIGYNSSGVYGWNYDVYSVNDVIISTGYRGMVGYRVDDDIIVGYDTAAREILKSSDTLENRKNAVNTLLAEFCNELKRDYLYNRKQH